MYPSSPGSRHKGLRWSSSPNPPTDGVEREPPGYNSTVQIVSTLFWIGFIYLTSAVETYLTTTTNLANSVEFPILRLCSNEGCIKPLNYSQDSNAAFVTLRVFLARGTEEQIFHQLEDICQVLSPSIPASVSLRYYHSLS